MHCYLDLSTYNIHDFNRAIAMSSATTARSLLLLAFISLHLLSPALAFDVDHRVNGRFDGSNPICSVLFRFDSGILP